jgi:hypothetical protein
LYLPFLVVVRSKIKIQSPSAALWVSCSQRLQQSSLLATRGLGETAIPFGKRGPQLAPPGLQVTKPGFEGCQLLGGQRTDTTAGSATSLSLTEDASQITHRKTDGERASN